MLDLSGVQGSVKKPQPRTATKPQAFLVTNFVRLGLKTGLGVGPG